MRIQLSVFSSWTVRSSQTHCFQPESVQTNDFNGTQMTLMRSKLGQLEAYLVIPVLMYHISCFLRYQTGLYWLVFYLCPGGELHCVLALQIHCTHCMVIVYVHLIYIYIHVKNTAHVTSWIDSVGADRHQIWVMPAGFGSSVCIFINLLLCTVSNFSSLEFCDVLPCRQRQDWFRKGYFSYLLSDCTAQGSGISDMSEG